MFGFLNVYTFSASYTVNCNNIISVYNIFWKLKLDSKGQIIFLFKHVQQL